MKTLALEFSSYLLVLLAAGMLVAGVTHRSFGANACESDTRSSASHANR